MRPIDMQHAPELAMLVHEYVTGRHYNAPDEAERRRWIEGTARFLRVLEKEGHVTLTGSAPTDVVKG